MSKENPKTPGPPRTCQDCGRRKVRHKVAGRHLCRRCRKRWP
jgi:hypothetical protein